MRPVRREQDEYGVAAAPVEHATGTSGLGSYVPQSAAPGQPVAFLRGSFPSVRARMLTLAPIGGIDNLVVPDGGFPYHDTYQEMAAGMVSPGAAGTSHPAIPAGVNCACVLEYGAGASVQQAVFDWRPGTYQLPPCSVVTVAFLPWGAGWAGFAPYYAQMQWKASVVTGMQPSVRVPVATAWIALTAVTYPVSAPKQAAAFDLQPIGDIAVRAVPAVGCGPKVVRDPANGAYVPPWGPVQLGAGGGKQWDLSSDADTTACLTWYLAL